MDFHFLLLDWPHRRMERFTLDLQNIFGAVLDGASGRAPVRDSQDERPKNLHMERVPRQAGF
jgi:hypothetical protein